ncbi:MAG: NUDIX hydrolase [Planctomycetota bacterium]|jgi:8-oxo-dGTP pyrophosphatase MutT (NUDIX family)|nr:NUDIX hydrolase [Planctomycetota bacterium]
MSDSWKLQNTKRHGDYRIFSVREDFYTHPAMADESSFFVIESPDWVNIIATTPDDKIILIRQFRPGISGVRLEIPGGIIDPDETPAQAASRELLEETGYRGDVPELICEVEPNPAIQNNKCFSYLIKNATLDGGQSLDPDEVIDIQLHNCADLDTIIAGGHLQHALLQLPILHFLRRRESN